MSELADIFARTLEIVERWPNQDVGLSEEQVRELNGLEALLQDISSDDLGFTLDLNGEGMAIVAKKDGLSVSVPFSFEYAGFSGEQAIKPELISTRMKRSLGGPDTFEMKCDGPNFVRVLAEEVTRRFRQKATILGASEWAKDRNP